MTIAEETVTRTPLNHARAQLGWTQQDLADAADVKLGVVRDIEQNRGRITLRYAYALLRALNQKRTEIGMAELALDDLTWEIRE